jgi:lipoprotein-anchoring transpeptidase ErfK/SrfK
MKFRVPLVVLMMLPAEAAFAQYWSDAPSRPSARSSVGSGEPGYRSRSARQRQAESARRYQPAPVERYGTWQGWSEPWPPMWREDRRRRSVDEDDDDTPRRSASPDRPRGQPLMSGGDRPSITPMPPQRVAFSGSQKPGTIVIDTAGRQLLLVTSSNQALRYPISVGRQGFQWTGTERISRIASWPDWHPPAEMRQRQPELPEKMTGGVRNPLGAKALYLGNSLYRIHGTNDARTIGLAASSGCFRMLNGHVVDLSSRVGVGTTVVVVNRLPRNVVMSQSGSVTQR